VVVVLAALATSSPASASSPTLPGHPETAIPGQGAATASPPAATAQQGEVPPPAPLSEKHRQWLEEYVVYIITPQEKEAFEALASDEERDLFIEAFWRARDPTPGTERNEAREEHERRFEYANEQLGRETPREGWQTDRGRVYIQLGEPRDIARYYESKAFWPMELWTYEANSAATHLPPFFYVMFYRPQVTGEYVLYDPYTDGPGALAKTMTMQLADNREVVRELLQGVGYEVAHASLSLNMSERPDFASGSVSMGNQAILANIAEAPRAGVDTGYTQVFLSHRGDVQATVAFQSMPVGLAAMAFWDDSGRPYLHYAVQIPEERVMLAEYNSDYYLSLAVSLDIDDLRGDKIESRAEDLEQHFAEQRAQTLVRSPLAYYDRLPLVPGVYDVHAEVINRVNEEGALARGRMSVPSAPRDEVVLGDLLVASATRPVLRDEPQSRAFQFDGEQFVPAIEGRVAAGSELHLFAQLIAGFPAQPGDVVQTTGTLIDADGSEVDVVSAVPIPPRPAPAPTPLNVTIPLEGVRPGPYTVRLTAQLPGDRTLSREKPIEVIVSSSYRDPMVLLAGEPPPDEARDLQARGNQHLRKGEAANAVAYFRAARDLAPNNIGLLRVLAQTLLDVGDAEEAARTISPLAKSPSASSGDALLLSIALREAGEPTGAAQTARVLLQRWRPTAAAYNALGDALVDLGQTTEAAQAYRDSLALDPEQPEIRAKLDRISGGGGV
jgi:GWxTD domain-containing protein